MVLVVKKFGGTSVGNVERIKRAARIVADSKDRTIVVVSAMAGVTNELVGYTKSICAISHPDEITEYDTVISSGEQITMGLMALALKGLGLKARSYLGWQVPIITNSDSARAKILEIPTEQFFLDLEQGIIPVVAGFQGVSDGRITTLGRGGSDTTAVAIAAAVGASRCDIYTDVDGIFTSDPRIITKAKKLDEIGYESVLEMASSGAKVVHPRAVEIAMKYQLDLRILNTFSNDPGTKITKNTKNIMENTVVTGIAIKRDLVMVTLVGIKLLDINLVLNNLFEIGVVVESLEQSNVSLANSNEIICDYSLVFSMEHLDRVDKSLRKQHQLIIRDKLGKISVVGIGIKNDTSVIKIILQTLKSNEISLIVLQLLETQISFVIEQIFTDQVVRNLHSKLGLDTK